MRRPGLGRGAASESAGRLKERIAELEADLAFLRSKHEALLAEGDRPRKENAVLRYDLQKCQRDRQVLDWHLNATRGELRMALALVRRYDRSPDGRGRALLEQVALLTQEARQVGVDDDAVGALEAAARDAWRASVPGDAAPAASDAVALRAARLLADLEAQESAPAARGAEDGWLPALRAALRGVVAAIVGDAQVADEAVAPARADP